MIFVDLDSTLNNFIFAWLEFMNKTEKKHYTIKDVIKWNSMNELYEGAGLFFIKNPYNIVTPFEGAKEFVEQLKKFDDVRIISDVTFENPKEKQKWIEKHFKNTKYIFTKGDKHDIIKKNDILIDDRFDTIYRVIKECGAFGLLYRHNDCYRYNDCIFDNHKFDRVNNYRECLGIIKKIYKKEAKDV